MDIETIFFLIISLWLDRHVLNTQDQVYITFVTLLLL